MIQWPFGSFLPEESFLRKKVGSNIIILFSIGNYYVAVNDSLDMLTSIGFKTRTSIVKNKQLNYCLLSNEIPLDYILSKLTKSHIAITKVLSGKK